MKKISLVLILCLSLLVGCTLGNTPTSRVEDFLSQYQMLNDNILISYTDITNDTNLNQDIRASYENAIKKQYQNLSYEVKEEVIDGNQSTVTVQIEVMNYKATIDKYNKNDYELDKYHELISSKLDNTKEKVTYTLDITLTKDDTDMWEVDPLTNENKDKLLGIY